MKRWTVACALTMCAAASLDAQGRGTRYDLPDRLSRVARDSVVRVLDSAAARQLPLELLLAKAAEGALKNATDGQIIGAVQRLAGELVLARSALPTGARTGTLAAAASALHVGITPDMVRELWSANAGADEASLGVALVTLADVVANGVGPATASKSIGELLRRRASETAMNNFRAGVAADILAGSLPEEALVARAKAVLKSCCN